MPKWDGMERLAYLMEDTFTVKDTPGTEDGQEDENWTLAQWGSVYILLGTIQRSYEPGVKLDEMLVIIGPPGIGKSTLLRHLLPPHLQALFSDGLDLAADAKERVEALQGRAIVEIGEMAGARRADLESLKTFLSRTDDGNVRLAYRHNPEPMPRMANLVGTADRSDPLPDDDNVRRFVPVTWRMATQPCSAPTLTTAGSSYGPRRWRSTRGASQHGCPNRSRASKPEQQQGRGQSIPSWRTA